jgi:hypothetical protein
MRRQAILVSIAVAVLFVASPLSADLTDGLLAYYPFNGNANDETGNGHDGTLHGDPILATDRFGNANSAYSFDGIHDYVEITNTSAFGFKNESFSVSLWAQVRDNEGGYESFFHLGGSGGSRFPISKGTAWWSGSRIYTEFNSGGACQVISDKYGEELPLNTWMHLVSVVNWETGKLELYADGVPQLIGPHPDLVSFDFSFPSPTKLFFGMGPEKQNYLSGLLDDVRIYNRALTASEVYDLYVVPDRLLVLHEPNGGERLVARDVYPINWSNTGSISEVLIEYSADNGDTWADVNTGPNAGSYDWIVPALNSKHCLVRISDTEYPMINDVSNATFTINNSIRLVPSEYDTIQAAIDDSNAGDTVIVASGTYRGDGDRDIDFKGKAITVCSADPNDPNVVEASIIDCNGTAEDPHRGLYFHSGEDANSVLEGFTITNGYGPNEPFGAGMHPAGGAVYCNNSSPTIRKCIIRNNYAGFWGGGLWFSNSRALVTECTFRENVSGDTGGGLYNRVSRITVSNCLFTDNSAAAGGGIYNIDGTSSVKNTIFVGNSAAIAGGALRNKRVISTITNCTFFGNQAPDGGAIHNVLCEGTNITNCILWANPDFEIEGDAEVSYCDVKGGYLGQGNIDADPCFADAGSGDYHLKSEAGRWDSNSQTWVVDDVTSPCIDTGDPSSSIGWEPYPNGGIANMGIYGGTEKASKSYFGAPVCQKPIAGDSNGDCRVDFRDFMIMALHWCEDNNP